MAEPKPPRAATRPTRRQFHGVVLEDPYAWLRDGDWRAAMRDPSVLEPDIRAYLEAENTYTDAVMAPTAELQTALVAEMRGRIQEEDTSVPARDGDWLYYSRFRAGGEHQVICRKRRPDGDEHILLDAEH